MAPKLFLTGLNGGIASSICQKFITEGYSVVGTSSDPHTPNCINCDLSTLDGISSASDFLLDQQPDVLINSAGFNVKQSISNLSYADLLSQFHITQWSTLSLVKAFTSYTTVYRRFILTIGSIWGHIGCQQRLSYGAQKSALSSLSRHLCHELSSSNILINTVSPGFIYTKLTEKSLGDPLLQPFFNRIPLQRLGDSQSVADLAYFLCCPTNTYITGQDFIIDGGLTIA